MQHDIGGALVGDVVDFEERPITYWEYSIHALLVVLAQSSPPLMTTDELRRAVENLESNAYSQWSYYEKWAAAMATILLERGVFTNDDLDEQLIGNASLIEAPPLFQTGDYVEVKAEDTRVRWRKPHIRCPGYIFGCQGVVESYVGEF
jgi:hypothetical protein